MSFESGDIVGGEQRKQAGQSKAEKHAGSQWLSDALFWLGFFCHGKKGQDVNMDEFRAAGYVDEPRCVNAWGALPRAAAREGIIQPTDRVVKAERAAAQARTVRVWRIA